MRTYFVTYQESVSATVAEHNYVMHLNEISQRPRPLNVIVAECRRHGLDATLRDAAGFKVGEVRADGTYQLGG